MRRQRHASPVIRRRGQTLYEYVQLLTLIGLVSLLLLLAFQATVGGLFDRINQSLTLISVYHPSTIVFDPPPDITQTTNYLDEDYPVIPPGGAVAPDGSLYMATQNVSHAPVIVHYNEAGLVLDEIPVSNGSADAVAVSAEAIYVAGVTPSGNVIVTAYEPDGDVLWASSIPDDSQVSALIYDDFNDKVYLTGTAFAPAPAATTPFGGQTVPVDSPFMSRIDPNGTVEWTSLLAPTAAVESMTGLAVSDSGATVYVVGMADSTIFGHTISQPNAFIASFAVNGTGATRVWSRTGGNNSFGWSVTVAPDTSVYMGGVTGSAARSGAGTVSLTKYSAGGTGAWTRALSGTGSAANNFESTISVVVGPGDLIYVIGTTTADSFGGFENIGPAGTADYFLAGYDSAGHQDAEVVRWGFAGDDVAALNMSAASLPTGPIWVIGASTED